MFNYNNLSIKVEYKYYGLPEYKDIKACCFTEFTCHVYACAIGHILVYVYGMSLIIKSIRVLLRHRTILFVLISVITAEISNVTFILTDPYGLFRRLPHPALVMLWKLHEVAFLWDFFLVNYFVSQKTRLNLSTFGGKYKQFILIVFKSSFVIVCEIISCKHFTDFPIFVLNDVTITIWTIFYTTIFIFNAPKLSNYVRETKKARRSFDEFSHSRKDIDLQNQDSTQKRLLFPKIRRSESSLRKVSLINISDSSLQDIKKNESSTKKSTFLKRPNKLSVKPPYRNSSSDSDSGSNGSGMFIEEIQSLPKEIVPNEKVNLLCMTKSEISMEQSNEITIIQPDICRISTELDVDQISKEQGYLADNEENIPNNFENCESLEDTSISKSRLSKMANCIFPVSFSFLSLFRMKQFTMLRRILKLCYVQITLFGIIIICKVYIIFSAYGGIFQSSRIRPRVWIIFQSVYRFIEILVNMIYVSVVYAVCSSSSKQQRLSRKRKL